ncbi:acyltransferase [Candidatus Thorarchaeota archaeon]|nr:MAG: acyltransferase [Candidatus Thorarchaeota archaeon]
MTTAEKSSCWSGTGSCHGKLNDKVDQVHEDWLDIAKGIAILFVILVHVIIPIINPITTHLSSFTIPLFFIVTGLTYNSKKYRKNIRKLLTKRGRQLMIPYISLYLLMIALFIPLDAGIDTYLTGEQLLFWFAYGAGPPDSSTHLWFLQVLFFALVLFAVIDKALQSSSPKLRWTMIIGLPIISMSIRSWFYPLLVPWRFSAVLVAVAFIFIGNEMRRFKGIAPWTFNSRTLDTIIFFLLSMVLILTSTLNGFTDIAMDRFGNNIMLYMANGVVGSILVFAISNSLTNLDGIANALQDFGRRAQEIYEIHPIIFYLFPVLSLIIGIPFLVPVEYLPLLWGIEFLLAFSISLFVARYVISKNRFLSLLFRGMSLKRRQKLATTSPDVSVSTS